VSHETIYLSLFVQSRGALRRKLTSHLRRGHATRQPLGHSVMNGQGQLRGTINISERPAEANDRAVPGHWEGDLLFGKKRESAQENHATNYEREATRRSGRTRWTRAPFLNSTNATGWTAWMPRVALQNLVRGFDPAAASIKAPQRRANLG
jgi:IS30 family transposase